MLVVSCVVFVFCVITVALYIMNTPHMGSPVDLPAIHTQTTEPVRFCKRYGKPEKLCAEGSKNGSDVCLEMQKCEEWEK